MANTKQRKLLYYEITRKEGWDIIKKSSSAYDKAIVSLATASFGFISALVKFSHNPIICKLFVMIILGLLIFSVFCSLLSFWFDQLSGVSIVNFAEESFLKNKNKEYKPDWSYFASIITKILAGFFFFISLVLFSILFYISL